MTSCVAIAQLRPGRKIFNRQHLQEPALGRRGGREREKDRQREKASQRMEEDRRKFNPCKAPQTDKRRESMQSYMEHYSVCHTLLHTLLNHSQIYTSLSGCCRSSIGQPEEPLVLTGTYLKT